MTDVNLASQLLVDAYENRFDTSIIISGGSDLSAPIKLVQERFPNKRVSIAFLPNRNSFHLKNIANGIIRIGADKLRQNLMQTHVTSTDGYQLTRHKTVVLKTLKLRNSDIF
jgi:uncharacterized LabA/DUF88 family protein